MFQTNRRSNTLPLRVMQCCTAAQRAAVKVIRSQSALPQSVRTVRNVAKCDFYKSFARCTCAALAARCKHESLLVSYWTLAASARPSIKSRPYGVARRYKGAIDSNHSPDEMGGPGPRTLAASGHTRRSTQPPPPMQRLRTAVASMGGPRDEKSQRRRIPQKSLTQARSAARSAAPSSRRRACSSSASSARC